MDDSMFACMNDEMHSVLNFLNGSFYALHRESCSKKMAINRETRVGLINKIIFQDNKHEGFLNWKQYEKSHMDGAVLCICGMLLENSFYIGRIHSDIKLGLVKACVGSCCIKQLDVQHNTTTYDKLMKHLKECPTCGKRKNIDDNFCKKCQEEADWASHKKEMAFQEEVCRKRKLDDKKATYTHCSELLKKILKLEPRSLFYTSINQQLCSKGFLSEKQIDCVIKYFKK